MNPILHGVSHLSAVSPLIGSQDALRLQLESGLIGFAVLGCLIYFSRGIYCQAKGCWRIGRYSLNDVPRAVCAKHHPEVRGNEPTHKELMELADKQKTHSG